MSRLFLIAGAALIALGCALPAGQANAMAGCGLVAFCPPPPPPPGPGNPVPPGNPNPFGPGNPYVPPDLTTTKNSGNGQDPVKLLIACRIGSKTAPQDLRFRNIGDATIDAGSSVTWQVKATGDRGTFLLPRDLPVGAELTAADLLAAGAPADAGCVSVLM